MDTLLKLLENVRGEVKCLWDLFLIWTVFRPVWSTNFSFLSVFLQYAVRNIHWQQAYCSCSMQYATFTDSRPIVLSSTCIARQHVRCVCSESLDVLAIHISLISRCCRVTNTAITEWPHSQLKFTQPNTFPHIPCHALLHSLASLQGTRAGRTDTLLHILVASYTNVCHITLGVQRHYSTWQLSFVITGRHSAGWLSMLR